ncbi:MAG: response regulator [Chloroflexi bacterium]|nr:response regulator [Chloroflexota bacterium]
MLTILLVEDNPDDAQCMRRYLDGWQQGNVKLVAAPGLEAALNQLQYSVEVVLLDLSLPDAQPSESYAAIHGAAPETPIIALLDAPDEDLALEVINHGAQDCLIKPQIDGARLIRSIAFALARTGYQKRQREMANERERVRLLQRFIQDAAHDLRTPLTVILVNVAALERALPGDVDAAARYLQLIEDQTLRLRDLLQNYLKLSYLELRDSRPQHERVDIIQLLNEIIREHDSFVHQRRHEVVFEESGLESQEMICDRAKLKLAITNIVTNAITYTPEAGNIIIRAYTRDGYVVFEIEDDGLGIEPNELPHIFNTLYRVDAARPLNTGGGGLGLPIARRIVEQHNGWIKVESEPGRGSLFRVVIPRQPPPGPR